MGRFLPPLVLVVTAFVVAELLPGSAPITQPGLWPFLLLIYGPGALLIRESARRLGRGWASVLLLGAAYGLIEEGLALQSLFNPALYRAADWGGRFLGLNGVYAEAAITIHAVWSVALPILLTDLAFPAWGDRPYLGRLGLAVTGMWYLFGAALLALLARYAIAPGYRAPPMLLAATALVALALAAVALFGLSPDAAQPARTTGAPRPWIVALTTFAASVVWHALLALLWRIQPAFASRPLVLVPLLGGMTVVVVMAWLLRQWAAACDWNDRHRLSLVTGALASHSLFGGAILADTTADRVGVAMLGTLTIALLALLGTRIRARGQ
jgi:hypothetical protein